MCARARRPRGKTKGKSHCTGVPFCDSCCDVVFFFSSPIVSYPYLYCRWIEKSFVCQELLIGLYIIWYESFIVGCWSSFNINWLCLIECFDQWQLGFSFVGSKARTLASYLVLNDRPSTFLEFILIEFEQNQISWFASSIFMKQNVGQCIFVPNKLPFIELELNFISCSSIQSPLKSVITRRRRRGVLSHFTPPVLLGI